MAVSPFTQNTAQSRSESTSAGEVQFLSRGASTRLRSFRSPVEIVAAHDIADVIPALARLQRAVDSGLHAAGFVSYEAGAAFEPAMPCREIGAFPYLWFGIYEDVVERELSADHRQIQFPELVPHCDADAYCASVARVRDLIAAGDTYQANFTFPLQSNWTGEPYQAFLHLATAQAQAHHRSFLNLGSFCIASASPELFFRLDGNRIVTRPMKGTTRRHPDPLLDRQCAEHLRNSEKERAENLMIVDLLRNDLGRIAETGSVQVEELFALERYQTLWTMTSTIAARTTASVPEIFAALFPSGSVTGAPKIRTMQILHDLEAQPRGVYCGAIGWWGPDSQAEFSVAIRTMVIDPNDNTMTYPVGSGITWDSDPRAEYEECLLKAAVLSRAVPQFELIESLRLDKGQYWLLDRHLKRLRESADYFGYPFQESACRSLLLSTGEILDNSAHKVRLTLSSNGALAISHEPLENARAWRVALASDPIDSQSPFVYNKTTHRPHYEAAKKPFPQFDDVILFSHNGELTETTRANIVLEIDGELLTPPRSAGLLPGTFREELLAAGTIREHRLTPADLNRARSIRLINSVRGWIDLDWSHS